LRRRYRNLRSQRRSDVSTKPDDEGDDLTDAERQALHRALAASAESAAAGRLRPVSSLIASRVVAGLLLLALTQPIWSQSAQQQPTFGTSTTTVIVDVVVRDRS
jgi:hypothetical protein